MLVNNNKDPQAIYSMNILFFHLTGSYADTNENELGINMYSTTIIMNNNNTYL